MPTLDGSSPARWALGHAVSGTESGTSASFTPPANSVLTVYATINSIAGATPTFNVPTFSGTGVGAFVAATSQINALGGSVCIWRASTTGAPTAGTISVSVTTTGGTGNPDASAWCDVWTSANATQTGAAVNASTSTTQNYSPTVTTTRAGSRVVGVGIDWNQRGIPTSADTISGYDVAGQTSGGKAIKAADSGAAGSIALNFNAAAASPQWSVVLLEIFASPAGSWRKTNTAGPGKHPGPRRFAPIAKGYPIAAANLTLAIDTAGALTIAGQSITASIGLALSTQGALTIAGQTVTPALTIPVTNGALTIAGQTATFAIGVAQSTQGAITIAGQSVPLSLAAPVTNGAITIAGQSAAFAINEAISTAGLITFNGQTVALDLAGNLTLSIEPGAIGIAGQAVQLDLTGDTAPPTQTPAGGSRTRRGQRRYVIRVDGKIFQADSEAEAVAILQQVAALADKAALNKADEIVERALPKAISLGAVKPIAIKAPALSVPGLSAAAEAAQQAIERAYANASAAAELRLLMAVLAAEEDEEEFLLLH